MRTISHPRFIAAAIASAVASLTLLPASQGSITFNLQLASGGNSADVVAGDVVHLTLFADITGPGAGMYDLGGSFTSNGFGGPAYGFQNAANNYFCSASGSQIGSSLNPNVNTIWGGGTAASQQYNSTGFFYARAGTPGFTGPIVPVLGNHIPLGTIDYVVSEPPGDVITLDFIRRDRPSITDQVWQENGVAIDDTTGTLFHTPVVLTVDAQPVPEPSSIALILVSSSLLMLRPSRRPNR